MTVEGFVRLATETVKDPQGVARLLMGINLPRETLWMALVLMCILSTLAVSGANILAPPPVDLPTAMANPFLFAAFLIGGSVLTVHALVWTGRAAGGQGQMGDMLI